MTSTGIVCKTTLVGMLLLGIAGATASVGVAAPTDTGEQCAKSPDVRLDDVTNPTAGEGGADAESGARIHTASPRRLSATELGEKIQSSEIDRPDAQVVVGPSETDADRVRFDVSDSADFDRTTDEQITIDPSETTESARVRFTIDGDGTYDRAASASDCEPRASTEAE